MKEFHTQSNIGKAKHVINFHDGIKKHSDGSRFFDIRIFNNKKAMGTFISSLKKTGYSEK